MLLIKVFSCYLSLKGGNEEYLTSYEYTQKRGISKYVASQ